MNRAMRRAQEKWSRKNEQKQAFSPVSVFDKRVGTDYKTPDGDAFRTAGSMDGGKHESLVRRWSQSNDSRAWEMKGESLADDIVEQGVKNIHQNAATIRASDGIESLPALRQDTAILVGAGGSLAKILLQLNRLKDVGSVFVTNRGLKAFADTGAKFDYAFMIDAKSYLFTTQDWWNCVDKSATCIASTYVHPSVLCFDRQHFFGLSCGYVPEWRTACEQSGIDEKALGALDSGLCALYSNLHLAWKMGAKRIVLLGHDFSLFQNMKYFDVPFHLRQEAIRMQKEPQTFNLSVREDLNQNLVVTQRFLEIQAKAIMAQIFNLVDDGIQVINGTCEGLLYGDCIQQIPVEKL